MRPSCSTGEWCSRDFASPAGCGSMNHARSGVLPRAACPASFKRRAHPCRQAAHKHSRVETKQLHTHTQLHTNMSGRQLLGVDGQVCGGRSSPSRPPRGAVSRSPASFKRRARPSACAGSCWAWTGERARASSSSRPSSPCRCPRSRCVTTRRTSPWVPQVGSVVFGGLAAVEIAGRLALCCLFVVLCLCYTVESRAPLTCHPHHHHTHTHTPSDSLGLFI